MEDCPNGWKQWWLTSKLAPDEKTYSNYLHAAWEAEKEETMEQSHSHTVGSPAKPKATSFFKLRKLKGNQPAKTPAVQLVHLEEEAPDDEEGTDSENPDGLDGMMQRNSWCASPEPWKMHSKMRNAVIIAGAQIISSGIVYWWN